MANKPWSNEPCPAWNAELKMCSLPFYPCVQKKVEDNSCKYCMFSKNNTCTYEKETRQNEKQCTSQEWRSCQRMFKLSWNSRFRMTTAAKTKRENFYKQRYGELANRFQYNGCPYLHITEHFMRSDAITCLAQNTCRPVTFSEFHWFCGEHLGSDFENKRVYYQYADPIRLHGDHSFFTECPYFNSASVPIDRILPTQNELRRSEEEANKKKERLFNVISSLENVTEGVSGEVRKMSEKTNNNSASGCYITTAVCNSFGKPDDCYELSLFREFRDGYLLGTEDGEKLVEEYYRTAPEIVRNIDTLPERDEIYYQIWQQYLSKCMGYIRDKELKACKDLYVEMVGCLENRYL